MSAIPGRPEQERPGGLILGIDLGTSNTYLFASRGGARPEAVVVPGVSDAAGSMATAVLYEDDAPILIGNMAESECYANPRPGHVLRTQFKPELAPV